MAQNGAPSHRTRVAFMSRPSLRDAVTKHCAHKLRHIFGEPRIVTPDDGQLVDWSQPVDGSAVRVESIPTFGRPDAMPNVEVKARAEYARARRALRALLKAVPPGEVCGPCTAFVNEHREAMEAITRDVDGKGTHWRQHSAERNSPTALAVDLYGSIRMTIGDKCRKLTDGELACLSLVNGATLRGDTASRCLEAETRAIRAARTRR